MAFERYYVPAEGFLCGQGFNDKDRPGAAFSLVEEPLVKQTIERTDSGDIAKKHGLKLEQAYWTVGAYDKVTIFEAPDEEAISAHLLEICSLGNVRTTTLRAYDEEECRG